MSCLLPQFRCLPDAFVVNVKSHQHSAAQLSKSKDHTYVRTQCILSTTSAPATATRSTVLEIQKFQLSSLEANSSSGSDVTWKPSNSPAMAAVLNVQKLKLLSLEAHSDSIAANRPWTYTGPVDSAIKANLGAALATESLIANEEAVIVAAAAEAVALAKAALKVAKDAAMMVSHGNLTELDCEAVNIPSEANSLLSNSDCLDRIEKRVSIESKTDLAEVEMENQSLWYPFMEPGDVEPTNEELEVLDKQLLNDVAVRSKRQKERKARRARAAERAAANVVSVKSGATSKKKRLSVQDVDYSDPLRYLRGTTATSRLLTASEEHELSEGIQDLLKLERLRQGLEQRCGAQPSFCQWAAAAGTDQKTLRKRINHGITCKDKMIKSNVRLVISIAKKYKACYQGSGMNLQDLVQQGCRGLVRGAEKFDASKGFKFSTYAHWWIKQAIKKSLSDQSRTIRLPFHMVEATYRVKEAKKQLYSEHGRHPDDEEVAQAAGLSMKRLSTVMLTPKAPRSLDQKIGMNQNLKPSEVIADPEAETAEDMLMRQFMKQDLEKVLDTLNPREKRVIRSRFGLDDGRMKTLQEIGELMGVSRERIRQLESSGFRKLKNKRRLKHLQPYLIGSPIRSQ